MRNLTLVAVFAGLIGMWQPAYSESGHNHKKSKTEEAHDDHDHGQKKKKNKHDDHEGHDHGEKHKDDHKTKDDHDHRAHEPQGSQKKHADAHGHDDEVEKFGEGKAITAVINEGESFALSSKAIGTLGIKFGSITEKSQNFIIPSSALVEYQENTGVYVRRKQWLTLVPVKIVREENGYIVINSDLLSPGEEIVITQTGLVRVAHLEASGQGGQGHAH